LHLKREKFTENGIKLLNEDLTNSYSSLVIVRMIREGEYNFGDRKHDIANAT
jgi:hypothetical protein